MISIRTYCNPSLYRKLSLQALYIIKGILLRKRRSKFANVLSKIEEPLSRVLYRDTSLSLLSSKRSFIRKERASNLDTLTQRTWARKVLTLCRSYLKRAEGQTKVPSVWSITLSQRLEAYTIPTKSALSLETNRQVPTANL